MVFDENIFSGRDITKVSTTKLSGFMAVNSGPLGQIYDNKPIYYLSAVRTVDVTPFDLQGVEKLPRVEIVYMYASATGEIIDYWINKKVDGLVIAGVGNGNFNEAFMKSVKKATEAGINVVRASRVPTGRVVLEDEIDDDALGTMASDDLNPQKARILLMLGLTRTHDTSKLQEFFFLY